MTTKIIDIPDNEERPTSIHVKHKGKTYEYVDTSLVAVCKGGNIYDCPNYESYNVEKD